MHIPSQHIFDRIVSDQSKNKLIENNLRGIFAEYLIVDALGDCWTICEGSWNAWDINGPYDTRLEVKSSAYIQSWYEWSVKHGRSGISVPRFDIAERKDGVRAADIYVFALHSERNPEIADHREPSQWLFYVVQSKNLPSSTKSIGVTKLQALSAPVELKCLKDALNSKIEKWVR